jgi:uncharacterized protein (TIGR03437 family)
MGSNIQSARAGEWSVPVLASSDAQSQIQIPFEVTGSSMSLAMNSSAGPLTMGLPLQKVSPAVFVDPDGSPFIVNADTGLMLDAVTPARSGARLQIFATGLGRVKPDWPAGIAAPLNDPPSVLAAPHVFLNGEAIEVSKAVLAAGYIGFYIVEVQLPAIVNGGSAEIFIEAGGNKSNPVRIFLEP